MRPLRAWVAWRSAVVRNWRIARVVVASVLLKAVSGLLLVRLLATATGPVFARQFGTAAPAPAAVVCGVWVGRSNCVARRSAARLARTVCDWRRGCRWRWRSCVVVMLLATAVLRSGGGVGGIDRALFLDQVPAVLALVVLGGVVLLLVAVVPL